MRRSSGLTCGTGRRLVGAVGTVLVAVTFPRAGDTVAVTALKLRFRAVHIDWRTTEQCEERARGGGERAGMEGRTGVRRGRGEEGRGRAWREGRV